MHRSQLSGRINTAQTATELGPRSTSWEAAENEYTLSLRGVLQLIRKRIWLIGLVAVVVWGVATAGSVLQTPMYESSIEILVGHEQLQPPVLEPVEGAGGLRDLTATMARIVQSRPIAEEVIRQLGLQMTPEDLRAQLTVQHIGNTQFIHVTYRDSSPERAQQVVNTIGDVFSEQAISDMSPNASAINVKILERAATPDEPVSPRPMRDSLLVLVLGLILGIGLAFLLENLDDSLSSPEEAERMFGVPTYGVIPEFEERGVKEKKEAH